MRMISEKIPSDLFLLKHSYYCRLDFLMGNITFFVCVCVSATAVDRQLKRELNVNCSDLNFWQECTSICSQGLVDCIQNCESNDNVCVNNCNRENISCEKGKYQVLSN